MGLYDGIVNRNLLIRRVNICLGGVVNSQELSACPHRAVSCQLDLFEDYGEKTKKEKERQEALLKEQKLQEARLAIKRRFGKNAILKGLNFEEGATAKERNAQIGGHKS